MFYNNLRNLDLKYKKFKRSSIRKYVVYNYSIVYKDYLYLKRINESFSELLNNYS